MCVSIQDDSHVGGGRALPHTWQEREALAFPAPQLGQLRSVLEVGGFGGEGGGLGVY